MDFFTRFIREKTPQSNFSRQNFSFGAKIQANFMLTLNCKIQTDIFFYVTTFWNGLFQKWWYNCALLNKIHF